MKKKTVKPLRCWLVTFRINGRQERDLYLNRSDAVFATGKRDKMTAGYFVPAKTKARRK